MKKYIGIIKEIKLEKNGLKKNIFTKYSDDRSEYLRWLKCSKHLEH